MALIDLKPASEAHLFNNMGLYSMFIGRVQESEIKWNAFITQVYTTLPEIKLNANPNFIFYRKNIQKYLHLFSNLKDHITDTGYIGTESFSQKTNMTRNLLALNKQATDQWVGLEAEMQDISIQDLFINPININVYFVDSMKMFTWHSKVYRDLLVVGIGLLDHVPLSQSRQIEWENLCEELRKILEKWNAV